jgi:glucose dehydrogenase
MRTAALAAIVLAAAAPRVNAQVTFDRILHAEREPANWLSYSGTLSNQRYSRLDQITAANAKNLELEWLWQAHSLEKFEATPLVVDGVLYTVQAPNEVVALDAATGRVFWTFPYEPAANARTCCGRVNRGLAILGDTLFMGTIDAHLLAIDAKAGTLRWDATVADSAQRYSITMSPVVVKDKVIVGTAGGDMGIRGVIAAFDATGRPIRAPVIAPARAGTLVRPHVHGATNWAPPSFSPRTGLFYVAHWEHSGIIALEGQFPRAVGVNSKQTQMGQTNLLPFFNDDDEAYGVIRAYDPNTLEPKWEYKMADITWGGVLSTAGDVVFGGGKEGYFVALDAHTGALLWKMPVGGQINAGAMSYAVNGKQYVAIAAGSSLFAFALP